MSTYISLHVANKYNLLNIRLIDYGCGDNRLFNQPLILYPLVRNTRMMLIKYTANAFFFIHCGYTRVFDTFKGHSSVLMDFEK